MLASSSSVKLPARNQVFINFRGAQLRDGFVSHLVNALEKHGINVFIDEHEIRGEDLIKLFTRIEESRIALVFFSSLYTESVWCLDELVKIKECVDFGTLAIIPIFYKIKISNVKRLEGPFGDRFRRSAASEYGLGKGNKWREAVEAVSRKFCIVVDKKRKESEFVDDIARAVLERLKTLTHKSTDLVRETHLKHSEELHVYNINSKINPFHPSIMASFSSSSIQSPPQDQVFINFQGTQLQTGFVSHLERALEREGINVGTNKYETDLNIFFSRIEQSRIALAIFSTLYTESELCLDELVKIMECVDLGKLVVIPIFYKVKVEDVKNLTGVFGEIFWELAKNCPGGKIDKWREAVETVINKKSITLGEDSDEGECINHIVEKVSIKLRELWP